MVRVQALLDRMKSTPIDMEILKSKLPSYCNAVEYKQLANKHRSELFKKYECVVVFIPSKTKQVGHFIMLSARDRYISYFSSLGGTPSSELNKLGESLDIFNELLGKNFITNTKKLQSGAYHINDCAVFCLVRCYLRKLKLREFQELFLRSQHLQTADDIVAMLCVLLLVEI